MRHAFSRQNKNFIISFRLTTRPPRSKTKLHPVEDNVNLSPAEKRYERVRRWTKKVNIFEKDFVIVPINEHSHWFVAVICYPGLVGKRRMDNNEVIPVCTLYIF
jgi:sentrin-specific protease 7